jgi:hypothetical protein
LAKFGNCLAAREKTGALKQNISNVSFYLHSKY